MGIKAKAWQVPKRTMLSGIGVVWVWYGMDNIHTILPAVVVNPLFPMV